MSVTQEQVEYIAHLARLQINKKDLELYTRNLSDILDFVAQLNSVDTSKVENMAHPLDIPQRERNDVVTEVDQRERFQAIAPATEAGLYLVPKVIEED